MRRGGVGLGDLLTALAVAEPAQKAAAARAAGYARPADEAPAPPPAANVVAFQTEAPATQTATAQSVVAEPAQAAQAAAPQSPYFWRVWAEHIEPVADNGVLTWLPTLQANDADFVSDLTVPLPQSPPLVSGARAAVALRRILAAPSRGQRVDMSRLVAGLARGRVFRHLPVEARARWPARLQVLVDRSHRLQPLVHEYSPWLAALRKTLRGRMRLLPVQGLPVDLDAQGRPRLPVVLDGSLVLVLGDVGLYEADGTQQHWTDLARRVQDAGGRTLALVPMPARLSAAPKPAAVVVWRYDETGVKRCGAARAHADVRSAGASAGALATTAALVERPGLAVLRASLFGNPHVTADLLRRLRVVAARHGHVVDLADELALWHHATVLSSAIACRLDPSANAVARAVLLSLPPELRRDIALAHWQTLLAGSPLLRAEFALQMQGLFDPGQDADQHFSEGRAAGDLLMRRAAAVQWRDLGAPLLAEELSVFVRGIQHRNAHALQHGEQGLKTAWVLAHRNELARGALDLPAGISSVDLQVVAPLLPANAPLTLCVVPIPGPGGHQLTWLTDPDAPPSARGLAVLLGALPYATVKVDLSAKGPTALFVQTWCEVRRLLALNRFDRQAFAKALYLGATARSRMHGEPRRDRLERVVHWLEFASGGGAAHVDDERSALEVLGLFRNWAVEESATREAGPEADEAEWVYRLRGAAVEAGAAVGVRLKSVDALQTATLTPSTPQALEVDQTYSVHSAPYTLRLDAIVRPAWAGEISCEAGVLTAKVRRATSGVSPRELRWVPAGRWPVVAGQGAGHFQLLRGCWWDAEDLQSLFLEGGQQLHLPSWAVRHGVDAFGYWAEFEIKGVVQRMRFVPPSRFWMGSPQAEAGRDDDETLHPVTLTRGYWLGDTVCTAQLWQAVVGKLPRQTSDKTENLPAVNISHDDVVQVFLSALDRLLPSFAWRLPSEAEWEHAARAGTHTAFAWGDKPAGDKGDVKRMNIEGQAKKQSGPGMIAANLLQPNMWGFRQMHGNVWEWCADALPSGYGSDEVIDPLADASGAGRVLRGGSWFNYARYCRSAQRGASAPDLRYDNMGFRLARGLPVAGRADPAGRGAPVLPAEPAVSKALPAEPAGFIERAMRALGAPAPGRKPPQK
jgi:formylglycine-generating enzyme required for sulfatase activity